MPLRGERHPGRPEAGEIGAQAEGLIVGAVRGEASATEEAPAATASTATASAAAVTEEKPAKAKGFGMAAGKKRPGQR